MFSVGFARSRRARSARSSISGTGTSRTPSTFVQVRHDHGVPATKSVCQAFAGRSATARPNEPQAVIWRPVESRRPPTRSAVDRSACDRSRVRAARWSSVRRWRSDDRWSRRQRYARWRQALVQYTRARPGRYRRSQAVPHTGHDHSRSRRRMLDANARTPLIGKGSAVSRVGLHGRFARRSVALQVVDASARCHRSGLCGADGEFGGHDVGSYAGAVTVLPDGVGPAGDEAGLDRRTSVDRRRSDDSARPRGPSRIVSPGRQWSLRGSSRIVSAVHEMVSGGRPESSQRASGRDRTFEVSEWRPSRIVSTGTSVGSRCCPSLPGVAVA